MTDQNSVRLAGGMSWYQDWPPSDDPEKRSWGGTMGLRIMTDTETSIFCKISYKTEDLGSNRLALIQKAIQGKQPFMVDGFIKMRTKGNKNETWVQSNLNGITILSSPSVELNEAVIVGKCTSLLNGWATLSPRYRNPKKETMEHRHIFVACQDDKIEDKWVYVRGRVRSKLLDGTDLVYVEPAQILY